MHACSASARVNPSAVTEDITETPLEIAATNVNTKAFDLLAPHYEENTRKKISQLMIWALTEDAPSAAFMLLFESVPLAEVTLLKNNQTMYCLMKNTKRTVLEGEQPRHPGFQPAADTSLQRRIGPSCVFARARVTYLTR